MRQLAISLVLVAACGGGKKQPGDGSGSSVGSDAGPPTIDAPAVAACTPTSGTNISMHKIGAVNGAAVLATAPPNDGRLFVVDRDGYIRIFQNEQLVTDPFLDITGIANFATGGEQGFLGLAFHPKYAQNNYFYVWYTTGPCPGNPPATAPCANVLERFTASAGDLNKADPTSGQVLLSIPDFATNHNAGMLEFGADGFLYISTGDGGAGGDPNRNAQNPNALLGKMLRIDVDHPANSKPYGIPTDNPYANGVSGAPEVYMLGLRNPWRWSFDRKTGDMWIGDVGQNLIEELDVLPAGQQLGKNLGWSMWEGSGAQSCYGNYTCNTAGITFPQYFYSHGTDPMTNQPLNAIVGGQVYRGTCYPDIAGTYFFSDNGAYPLIEAKLNPGNTLTTTELAPPAGGWPVSPASIHADARGELYMTTTDGSVYHLEAGP